MRLDARDRGARSVVAHRRRPIVPGPLFEFSKTRPEILSQVMERTLTDLRAREDLESLLSEALYAERSRLKKEKRNVWTRERLERDRSLWKGIQEGMYQSPTVADRRPLLETVVHNYAEEIGGHFDPRVYQFATVAVPWAFSWMLNAASVRRFLPWGMTESLENRLRVVGEVPHLQKLAEKGTILMVPTHQSNIDSVLIGYVIYLMGLTPFSYGAGLNLFSNPALNFFMSRLGAYTVDRQKNNPIYKATLKNYSTQILQRGVHSIFFPGGGRSRSGALESHLKLGLLGTGLDAQLNNLVVGHPRPNVYVVPMVTSYHFVLEAESLIEDYLAEAGRHRFVNIDTDSSSQPIKVARFFWKVFSSQSEVFVRLGRPMDIFGNPVDEEGRSIGPNGRELDPKRWLTTRGVLGPNRQRDQEYTRDLGTRIVERFHCDNTVLSSHAVAFAFMEALRRKYPDYDLFRLLRLTRSQRSMTTEDFEQACEGLRAQLLKQADQGQMYLEPVLLQNGQEWIEEGVRKVGLTHGQPVLARREGAVWSEDLNTLYYYRNRLSGYGLSKAGASNWSGVGPGSLDGQGFLV